MAAVRLVRQASATLVKRQLAAPFFSPLYHYSSFTSLQPTSVSTLPVLIKPVPCNSLFPQSALVAPELCGRGDRSTKKGKRFRGTYGKARPKKDKKIERIKEKVEVPSSTPWPLPFKLI